MKLNIAVILAAGRGERTGFSKPKQLVKLAGRPLVAHTIQHFQNHHGIDEIAVITSSNCISEIDHIVTRDCFTKVKKILLGGTERYESSIAAIRAYETEASQHDINLIFHDAVRPLVNDTIISGVIDSLNYYNAVDVTIPAADTVVISDPVTNTLKEIPDRRLVQLGQTPQGFKYHTIKKAYEIALRDPSFRTTDDCGVVLKYLPEEKIGLVMGASNNVKLTYPDDMLIIDKFMQTNAGHRLEAVSNTIILSALKGHNLVVFGGTSGIGAATCRMAQAFGANVYIAGRSTGVDITNSDAVKEYLDNIAQKTGRIDSIINTAAVLCRQPLANMSQMDVITSVQTNYLGSINVAKYGYEHLKASNGHLIFFASSSYTYGRAYYSTYSSSKAAIVNLTQALSDEWAESGIRVNCISPERTNTQMRTKAFGNEPKSDLLNPDEVAKKTLCVLIGASTGYIYDITKS